MNESRVRALMDAALGRAHRVVSDAWPPRAHLTPEMVWSRVERTGQYSLLARALAWYSVEDLEHCDAGQLAVLAAMLNDPSSAAWLDRIPMQAHSTVRQVLEK